MEFSQHHTEERWETLEQFHQETTKGDFRGITMQYRQLEHVSSFVKRFIGQESKDTFAGLNILFPNAKWIYLYRHDKVKQAVSLAKVKLTQEYVRFPTYEKREVGPLVYEEEAITKQLRNLSAQDSFWLTYFQRHEIAPFFVSYEELLENKLLTSMKIFEFLEHKPDKLQMNPDFLPIPLYDTVSQEWYDKYNSKFVQFN